jgi:hypothetical protein
MISAGKSGCKTVGTSAALLMSSKANMPQRGIKVKALRSNTAPIYISFESTITADSTEATAGWILENGQEDFIETAEPEKLYVRSSAASQLLSWWIQ